MSSLFLQRDVVNDVVKYDIALWLTVFSPGEPSERRAIKAVRRPAAFTRKDRREAPARSVISQFSLDYCDLIC
jgi:hypothetical protein